MPSHDDPRLESQGTWLCFCSNSWQFFGFPNPLLPMNRNSHATRRGALRRRDRMRHKYHLTSPWVPLNLRVQKNHRIFFNQLSTIWPQSLHVHSITLPSVPNQTELLQLCPPVPCAEDKLQRTIPISNTPFKRSCSIQLST